MVTRLKNQFSSMFRRRMFLFGFQMYSGLDEMELVEAECDAADLLSELQQYMNQPSPEIYGNIY